jgi:hypothetical protein
MTREPHLPLTASVAMTMAAGRRCVDSMRIAMMTVIVMMYGYRSMNMFFAGA